MLRAAIRLRLAFTGVVVAMPLIVAAWAAFPAPALGEPVAGPEFWGVDGEITSIARAGNTVFAVGRFNYIGPNTGSGVPLDPVSGAPLRPYPRVAGIVRVAISDGQGGWFIGGDFTAVEGQSRPNLAHLLADGTLADFRVDIREHTEGLRPADPNQIGSVAALALHGSRLYIGGRFPGVGDIPKPYLVVVNASTGALGSFAQAPDGPVSALAIHSNRLYVGGKFTRIGAAPRACLAALDPRNGEVTDWNPTADGAVLAFAFHGRTVFVGGEFDHAGGAERNSVAGLDIESGAATAWDAQALPLRRYIAHGNWIWPFVAAMELRGSALYVAGYFGSFRGVTRPLLAALDVTTGRPTRFDAHLSGGFVKSLALAGNALYLGGYFINVGGAQRPNAAAVDATTGQVLAWNPRVYGIVHALAANDASVFTGGMFFSLFDWREQINSVAFDAATGEQVSWNPNFGGRAVYDLLGSESTLYAAGDFLAVNGQARGMMAAFDAATGQLLPWNPWSAQVEASPRPGQHNEVRRLARNGNTLYAGGLFDQINGLPRSSLAAFDATTGATLDWNPSVRRWDRSVSALVEHNGDLFVGGTFDSVGFEPRRDLAQVDGVTGRALPFDTQPGFPMAYRLGSNPDYRAIAPIGDRVFVGGWIYDASARRPYGVVAFDALGAALPWNARLQENPNWVLGRLPAVDAITSIDRALIIGGRFDVVGGASRLNLAALDLESGNALDWNPDAGFWPTYYDTWGVSDLQLYESTIYVGGGFRRLGGYPCAGIGAFTWTPTNLRARAEVRPQGRIRTALSLASKLPIRAGSTVTLELALPSRSPASLDVFDVQGRRIATPMRGETREPGNHAISLDTRGWRPGLYYCRLAAAGDVVTGKLLLVR